MKTRFRVAFRGLGWAVEYRNSIWGDWCSTDKKVYKEQLDAINIVAQLKTGVAPDAWYPDV